MTKSYKKPIIIIVCIIVAVIALIVNVPKKQGDRVGRIVTLDDHYLGQTEASLLVGEQGSNLWHFTIRDSGVKKKAAHAMQTRDEVSVHYSEVFMSFLPADTNFFATDITTIASGTPEIKPK